LLDELVPIFRDRTLAEWMDVAITHDIPLCPANSKIDTLTDPHLRARQIVHDSVHPVAGPYTSTGWPAPVDGHSFDIGRHAPALGEQTEEILGELGLSAADVAGLRERGVA
jgi:formyl-CoA transferase